MAFYDQDIPNWMNPARNVLETGREATPGIGHNFAAAFLQQQENKTDLTKLRVEELRQGLELNKLKIGQMFDANKEVADWIKASNGDPVWMVNNPYMGNNPVAAERINQAQIRATQSVKVQKAGEDLTQFNKRLLALPPDSRADIQGMSDDPRTGLPSADKWRALAVAEQAEVLRQENLREAAALEAQSTGTVPTTAIGPKGVTTTYRPPTASQAMMGEPTVRDFPDGSKLIHVSPNRWQYVKGEVKKDLSPNQLMDISKALKELDANDPTAAAIDEALKESALKQIKPQSKNVSSGTAKVRMVNPQGVAGYVPADQVDAAKAQGYKLAPQ